MASYFFEMPPEGRLTPHQKAAVYFPGSIALHGGAGTGKSVVSLYRHIRNFNMEPCKISQLLTYTTTLSLYLRSTCKNSNIDASLHIESTYRWLCDNSINFPPRDEIIIDEAQDIKECEYQKIKSFYPKISYGADEVQKLFKEGATIKTLTRLFVNNRTFTLTRCFRNSKSILRLAFYAFPDAPITLKQIESCPTEGNIPVLLTSNDPNKLINAIFEVIETFSSDQHNIAVLCPFSKDIIKYYKIISAKYPTATYYYSKGEHNEGCKQINNIHITTFKSAKGLEFDTVIIPNFEIFNYKKLDYIDWRDFYVGVTRAKTNLYLISNKKISELSNVVIENIIE
jgi:superfamily I DNA/RNA helicase